MIGIKKEAAEQMLRGFFHCVGLRRALGKSAPHSPGASLLAVLHLGDDEGAGGVAGDVDGGTAHVKDTVDTGHQGDALDGQTHALQHHGQHDHARAGHAGGADGGQGGGEDDGDHVAQ